MVRYIIILFISCSSVISQTIYDFAKNGDIQAIEALDLQDKIAFNLQNESGYTPLMLAAYYNKTDMILYLLKNKATINATSPYGTALMAATVKGHKEAVVLLLKDGADPNISDKNKATALQFAALFNHYDIAEYLLKQGANINAKDFRGNKALDYAIMKQNEPLIKLLNIYQ
jgi:ankyrin repeat protein